MTDFIKISGFVTVQFWKPDGVLKVIQGPNLVTSVGQEMFTKLFCGEAEDVVSHMAMGTSNIASAKSMTALQGTEIQREALTITRTGNTIDLDCTFPGTREDTEQIGEFGIFNDDTAGSMFCRWTCPLFDLNADAEPQVNWRITIGS